jgi:hypothetical protein
VKDLGTLSAAPAGATSDARAINAAGLVVGSVGGLPNPNDGGNNTRTDAVAWERDASGNVTGVDLSSNLHKGPGTAPGTNLPLDVGTQTGTGNANRERNPIKHIQIAPPDRPECRRLPLHHPIRNRRARSPDAPSRSRPPIPGRSCPRHRRYCPPREKRPTAHRTPGPLRKTKKYVHMIRNMSNIT